MYFRADMSAREVAEETRLGERVVRHSIQKLIQREVLCLRPFVNPFSVGLSEYVAFIATQFMSADHRDKLLGALLSSARTTYVGAIGGDFHLAVMLVAKDLTDVTDFLDELSVKVGGTPFTSVVASCVAVSVFAPKFLGTETYGPGHMTYRRSENVTNIDSLDDQILHALAALKNNSISHLARTLGMPISSVTSRLASLKKRGILVGLGYTLPPFNDGLYACALQIYVAAMPKDVRHRFFDFCLSHPSISYLIETVGAWSFQVGARLSDPRYATFLVDEIQQKFAPYIPRIVHIPVHGNLKLCAYPLMLNWAGGRAKRAVG
jgi:DNA-binding Lrp family transcriptional regulator